MNQHLPGTFHRRLRQITLILRFCLLPTICWRRCLSGCAAGAGVRLYRRLFAGRWWTVMGFHRFTLVARSSSDAVHQADNPAMNRVAVKWCFTLFDTRPSGFANLVNVPCTRVTTIRQSALRGLCHRILMGQNIGEWRASLYPDSTGQLLLDAGLAPSTLNRHRGRSWFVLRSDPLDQSDPETG